ncbi:hypothetical protein INR49_020163 [Caranx melampygus]|nr:hypothetical protein INR49_020163 [Caranx melampygus]
MTYGDVRVVSFDAGKCSLRISQAAGGPADGERPRLLCLHTSAKKWHWRARTAALHFSQTVPTCPSLRVLFSSSVLNLCELVALRPDLARLKKVLYFHENQLVYPVRKDQDRDFQYGYNQILSCLVADVVVFNSLFNMDSFLSSISTFINKIPDHRPSGLDQLIRPKCVVLHYPVQFPDVSRSVGTRRGRGAFVVMSLGLCLVKLGCCLNTSWFSSSCSALTKLRPPGLSITRIHISPHVNPVHRRTLFLNWTLRTGSDLCTSSGPTGEIFSEAKRLLEPHILTWGFQSSKEDYLRVLCEADVVVSTAKHEFFGVAISDFSHLDSGSDLSLSQVDLSRRLNQSNAVLSEEQPIKCSDLLEAVHCGCYPLCPKALVYPEIFPAQYLYSKPEQLCKRLKSLCRRPDVARRHIVKVDTSSFSWTRLQDRFKTLLADGGS